MMNRFLGKKIILLFVSAVLCEICVAQEDPKIDSLLKVLKTLRDDTTKVNTLNALSEQSLNTNFNLSPSRSSQALTHAENALLLAEKLNFKKGMAVAYECIGEVNRSNFNFSEALKNLFSSLKLRIEIGNKPDLATCYNSIATIYDFLGNYSEALKYCFTSLKISQEIGDKKGIFRGYWTISFQYNRLFNYPEVLKWRLAALKIAEEIGDKQMIISSNNGIGAFFREQENFPQALKYYLRSLKTCKEIGDQGRAADMYDYIGDINKIQGNYPEALKSYRAALTIREKTGYKYGIAASYRNIASLDRTTLSFADALKNYQIAHTIFNDIGGRSGRIYYSYSYRDIGDTYLDWAQQIKSNDSVKYREQLISEALKNYSSSLKVSEEIELKAGISLSYEHIAKAYHLQKKFQEALKNYLAALEIRKGLGGDFFISSYYLNIGDLYIELKKFPEAKEFLNHALSISKETGNKVNIKESYDHLTALDNASGNWEGAYQNYKMFILYRDSLASKENTEKIMRLQMQYEFDKQKDSLKYQHGLNDEKLKQQILLTQQQRQTLLLKEKEFALIRNEKQLQQLQIEKDQADYAVQIAEANKKQGQLVLLNKEKVIQTLELKKQRLFKNYLLAGLVLFSILSLFVYNNYRTRQKLKLQTLRNEIARDLHDDVGSTLSSISIFSEMAKQQSKEVIPMLDTIGESSRKMLDAMADIVWTIKPENDQFEKIILRMRSFAYELLGAKKIDFEFVADDDIAKMKLPMEVRKNLYLIFKEATNNMVKYSAANKAMFTLSEEKNNLTMFIRDNGKGFDVNKSTGGNGLKNMKKRAIEIGAQLTIESFPGNGTTIQVSIAV